MGAGVYAALVRLRFGTSITSAASKFDTVSDLPSKASTTSSLAFSAMFSRSKVSRPLRMLPVVARIGGRVVVGRYRVRLRGGQRCVALFCTVGLLIGSPALNHFRLSTRSPPPPRPPPPSPAA